MKETNYVRNDGTRVPVSRLSDAELAELLAVDIEICASDGHADEPHWVRERLRIEVTIRSLGMSANQ